MLKLKALPIIGGSKVSPDFKTGKFRDYEEMYRLKADGKLSGTDVGLPCRHNRLVIIDVDAPSDQHKHDGRQWVKDNEDKYPELFQTYRVETPSGGCHFYFKLPIHFDEILFFPPKSLAPGVDVKWNGYVVAPPTKDYRPIGVIKDILEITPNIMELLDRDDRPVSTTSDNFHVNVPISLEKGQALLSKLKVLMPTVKLDRDDWIKGIFSITSAIDNEELREECIFAFTRNKAYVDGDEDRALAISQKSDPHGNIGPGTILKMVEDWLPTKAEVSGTPKMNLGDIYAHPDLYTVQKNNATYIVPTESNASVILSILFPHGYVKNPHAVGSNVLYFDTRFDREIVKSAGQEIYSREELVPKCIRFFQQDLKMSQFKSGVIEMGLNIIFQDRRIDPLRYKAKTVKWDGVRRISRFFTDYYPCKHDNEKYLQAASLTLWRSLIYRVVEPGIKSDEVVVLIGKEGLFKSTVVSKIACGYAYGCGERNAFKDRDPLLNMHKSAVVELEEMVPLIKCDADTAKGYITRSEDRVREMFGRKGRGTPRSFIMVGTSNRQTLFNSIHGIRRYIPLIVKNQQHDMFRIEEDIDQFYAEAYHDYVHKQPHFGLITDDFRRATVMKHMATDTLANSVKKYIKDKPIVSAVDLFTSLRLGGLTGTKDAEAMDAPLSEILSQLDWIKDEVGNWKNPNKVEVNPDDLSSWL